MLHRAIGISKGDEMNIALLTTAESMLDILPELSEFLRSEIINAEVGIHYLPTLLEVPAGIKSMRDYDLVVFFHMYYYDDYRLEELTEKLMGLEMELGIKIILAAERSEDEELSEGEALEAEKKSLVAKWGRYILDRLFHEEKFKPGYVPEEEGGGE